MTIHCVKVSDWSGTTYTDRRYMNKYNSQYGGGNQYSYFHDEDESSFQLVDNTKVCICERKFASKELIGTYNLLVAVLNFIIYFRFRNHLINETECDTTNSVKGSNVNNSVTARTNLVSCLSPNWRRVVSVTGRDYNVKCRSNMVNQGLGGDRGTIRISRKGVMHLFVYWKTGRYVIDIFQTTLFSINR